MACGSLNPEKRNCATPQLVQTVELTLLHTKDMHNNVTEIHQQPTGIGVSLGSKDGLPSLFQALLHGLSNCLALSARLHGHQDESVRVRTDAADIKEDNIAGLPILRNPDGATRNIDGVRHRSVRRGKFACHWVMVRYAPRGNNAPGDPLMAGK